MAYRKLGRDNKHRRSMLATMTKQVVENESITTTETRAKEVRKFVEKMITYGKKGDLVSRRKALAFLHNDKAVVDKIFNDLAKRYENRSRSNFFWSHGNAGLHRRRRPLPHEVGQRKNIVAGHW